MCGCEAHHNGLASCTCACDEHHMLRIKQARKETKFDFSINLYELSAEKLASVRAVVEEVLSPLDDVSYTATIREM